MVALDKIWGGLQTVIMMDEILRPKKMLQKGSVGIIAVVNPHNNSHNPNLPQKACHHHQSPTFNAKCLEKNVPEEELGKGRNQL